jgi:hypothetical protein
MGIKRLLTVATLGLLSLLGIGGGFKLVQDYTAQKKALAESSGLIASTQALGSVKTLAELQAKDQQVQRAISTLASVLPIPGSEDYRKAQADLTELRSLAVPLAQRLQTEQQAADHLAAALALDQEASAQVKQQPCPPEQWQTARASWQQAIARLEQIPPNTLVSAQAKEGLRLTRTNYGAAGSQQIMETRALQNIDFALEAAERAAAVTAEPVSGSYSRAQLMNARTLWVRAINFLSKIPNVSFVAKDAVDFYGYYKRNLDQIDAALADLNQCLAQTNGAGIHCQSYHGAISVQMPATEAVVADTEANPEQVVVVAKSNDYARSRYRRYRSSRFQVHSTGTASARAANFGSSFSVRSSGSSFRSSGFGSSRSGSASS